MKISRKFALYIMIVLLLVFGVIILLSMGNRAKAGTVTIEGFDTCSPNIRSDIKTDVFTRTYGFVKSANDYNKVSSKKSYIGKIRDGSCVLKDSKNITNYNSKQQIAKSTSVIVDIPDAKQSWKITYSWLTRGSAVENIDIGTATAECLPQDKLLYGDFKCENILSLAKYGTDKADPILQYMPYTGAGFRIEYDADTRTVSIAFDPPPGTTDTAAFIANTKAIIPYWFQKRNLDQSQYKIIYSDQIDRPDDNQQ